jgi:hypothetical protein
MGERPHRLTRSPGGLAGLSDGEDGLIMKRIYEWITKANQVLLFLSIIAAMLLMLYIYFETRQRYEPPTVAIAQSAEEAQGSAVQDVNFLDEYDGIYVFGLMKRMILDESARRRLLVSSLGNEESRYPGHMVNVAFSRADQPVRKLLQNDGLILSHRIAKHSEKLKASVFVCVTEDTDANHQLDENDRKDLYVVSENLDRPDVVIRASSDYRVISPTRLVVKTTGSDGIHFWDVDIEAQGKKELPWK